MSKIAVIGLVGESVFLPVEKFHVGGETLEAKSFYTEPGGKGFNQAVAAARFGAEVSFLAAVGSEGYGDTVETFLKSEDVTAILPRKADRTAYAVIITDASGANRVTEYTGAELEVDDLASFYGYIEDSDILLLSNEVPAEVNEAAAEYALRKGVRVILNPAPYRKLNEAFMENIYLFTPNEHETGGLDGFENVIVTLGGKGCLIRQSGEAIPATDDVPVDTTGAGDTFNGVLAVMLAEGASVMQATGIAVKASGRSVTKKGAVASIPRRSDIIITGEETK